MKVYLNFARGEDNKQMKESPGVFFNLANKMVTVVVKLFWAEKANLHSGID